MGVGEGVRGPGRDVSPTNQPFVPPMLARVKLEYRDTGAVRISTEGGPLARIDWRQVFLGVHGVLQPMVQVTDLSAMLRDQFARPWLGKVRQVQTGGFEEEDERNAGDLDTVGRAAKAATLRAVGEVFEARRREECERGEPLPADRRLTLGEHAVVTILDAMSLPEPSRATEDEWERGVIVDDILSGLVLAAISFHDRTLSSMEREGLARGN